MLIFLIVGFVAFRGLEVAFVFGVLFKNRDLYYHGFLHFIGYDDTL